MALTLTAQSPADLPQVARQLLDNFNQKIILLKGAMGAGKTTLIKALCAALGVEDEVSSPTFSLVNEYAAVEGLVYHFDFYRIKDEMEALDIGLEEYLDSGHYCFMEWPEKISNLLAGDFDVVEIGVKENGERVIELRRATDEQT